MRSTHVTRVHKNQLYFDDRDAFMALLFADNFAIVYRDRDTVQRAVAQGWHGFPAIDGDISDMRHTDPPGHVVALYAKGAKARQDRSGMVRDIPD